MGRPLSPQTIARVGRHIAERGDMHIPIPSALLGRIVEAAGLDDLAASMWDRADTGPREVDAYALEALLRLAERAHPRVTEAFAVAKVADYELTTALTPAQIVAGCRAMHDMQGSEDADGLVHHPAAKSWEPKTEPRWSQWIETVVFVADAIGRQALAEEAGK